MSEEPAPPRFMDVALEFSVGTNRGNGKKQFSIKKLAKSQSSLRFMVRELPSLMDHETVDHVTATLLDELERLPVPGRVAKVLLSGLRFTERGANALQGFFASHANTVRHLALHHLLTKLDDADETAAEDDTSVGGGGDVADDNLILDTRRVGQIVAPFAKSPLTVLDLSRNSLYGSTLWKTWAAATSPPKSSARNGSNGHTPNLRQLIMDSVYLDHESWLTLSAKTFDWTTLDDLHVVLEQPPPTDAAMEAAQNVVRCCTRLSSLRWIQKRGPARPLPWIGLRDMARSSAASGSSKSISSRGGGGSVTGGSMGGSLRHLVLEGPGTPEFVKAHDVADLTSTLQDLPRLKTLKLRHLGLTDLSTICAALRSARPPLEVVDFSYNEITSNGASRLCDLMRVARIANQLTIVVMNDNRLETNMGRELLETFGSTISIENNPGLDLIRIVTDLMASRAELERERNDLRKQLETRAHESSSANSGGGANAEILQMENRRLREEREILAQAFSVMGISHQVEEHKRLLDRVQRLEDMVLLGSVLKDGSVLRGGGSGGGGGGGGGHSDMASVASGASKMPSRRRINVNELNLERLTAAAASVASRGPSARSNLSRTHSNRSTASRGNNSLGGGSDTNNHQQLVDESTPAVMESPHNTSLRGRSYTRTPTASPGQRPSSPGASIMSLSSMGGGGAPTTPLPDAERRGLASSLRQSSYYNPNTSNSPRVSPSANSRRAG